MLNTSTPARCDVVVIGAGMGGLTSAALLTKAGLDVCVVEAEVNPGGYLAGFKRKGFSFDTAVHWLNQCGPDGFVRRIFDFIGPGSPQTRQLDRIRRYKGDSFDYLLTSNPDDLRDQLIREFPAEEKGTRAFFTLARKIGVASKNLQTRMRSIDTRSSPIEKCVYGLDMLRVSWRFLRYNNWGREYGLDSFFKEPAIRRVFNSHESFMACLMPIGWAYTKDYQVPPVGGGPAFPHWLAGVLDSWGSTIAYRSRVTEIILEGNRAVGVRLTRGKRGPQTEIRCKYVVAACDLEALYERMLPAGTIDDELLKTLHDADLYESSTTISLGVNCDPRSLGLDEELVSIVREDLSYEDQRSGDPEKAGITVMSSSVRDPTLAPPGKGTLTIYVGTHIRYGENWKTGPDYERGPEYQAFKQEYTDKVLERVEETLPGLRESIEICDTATPITHRRWTGNRDGSIMGARPTTKNIRAGTAHYITPVENLLLGGMWAEYGGGVPVAVRAGLNSALIILKKEKPAAFRILRSVADGKISPLDVSSPELKTLVEPIAAMG